MHFGYQFCFLSQGPQFKFNTLNTEKHFPWLKKKKKELNLSLSDVPSSIPELLTTNKQGVARNSPERGWNCR